MVAQEDSPKDKSPEGLTVNQEILADMLFETKQIVPVTRRIALDGGGYEFQKIERPTSPIDFAQEGEFALKMHEDQPDAPLSPVYVNFRNLPERVLDRVGLVLSEIPTDEPADFCAGIPKAGLPLAEAYSRHSGIPVIDIFGKEEKTGGRRKIVAGEGIDTTGTNVRLIDDLATGGETKLEAIRAAEEMGLRVVDILVLVDRQQGATEQLKEAGYTLKAAFTLLDQLLKYGLRTDKISVEQYNQVKEYLNFQAA